MYNETYSPDDCEIMVLAYDELVAKAEAAALTAHETYSANYCELMVLEISADAAKRKISAAEALHQIVDMWRHCSNAARGVTEIAEAEAA